MLFPFVLLLSFAAASFGEPFVVPEADSFETWQYMTSLRNPEDRARDPILEDLMRDNRGHESCSFNGWRINGTSPYCDCFFGYSGEHCSISEPAREIKGAITFLLNGDHRYFLMLLRALEHLWINFTSRFRHTVVILHSANFEGQMVLDLDNNPNRNISYLEYLQLVYQGPIRFQRVEMSYPPNLKEEYEKNPPNGMPCRATDPDYLHMLRFFTFSIFHLPIFSEFDYVWRLDADICLLAPIPCDIFKVMADSRAVFGFYYFEESMVPSHCLGDYRSQVDNYLQDNHISPTWYPHLKDGTEFLGAWGVMKSSFWTSPTVLHFAQFLDQTGLAYRHRFGEQKFFPTVLSVFAPASGMHQFARLGPFGHRKSEIIWGPAEMNGFHMPFEDPYCRNPVHCDEFLYCSSEEQPMSPFPWIEAQESESFGSQQHESSRTGYSLGMVACAHSSTETLRMCLRSANYDLYYTVRECYNKMVNNMAKCANPVARVAIEGEAPPPFPLRNDHVQQWKFCLNSVVGSVYRMAMTWDLRQRNVHVPAMTFGNMEKVLRLANENYDQCMSKYNKRV